MQYAIIDIETTGGNPFTDKITEIAVYVHNGKEVVREFESLVNPERAISPFITQLTGISNEMVADAPLFYEIAKELVEITSDCIFVAHNVNFDYRFVRHEFQSLGYDYQRKTLDTVRLSRKLLPGHTSYSLGKLCADLEIVIKGRHRAAGDALATVQLFDILLAKNDRFLQLAFPQQYGWLKDLDSEQHKNMVKDLPEAVGVYYFYDGNGELIYVGKSINIRKRVAQHLRNNGGQKALEMRERIAEVSYELTGSELVALLFESHEIKTLQPVFNRAQRRSLFAYGLFAHYDLWGYTQLRIDRLNTKNGEPLATFVNKREAEDKLYQLVEKYHLCQKLCGLYKTEKACFHYGVGQCNGACVGEEDVSAYNSRVNQLVADFSYQSADFIIVDKGRKEDEKSLVQVVKGKYMGFGYLMADAVENRELVADCIQAFPDNRDVRQIIQNYMSHKKFEALLE